MTTSTTRAAGLCALLATTCLVTPSQLHAAAPVAAPPVQQSIDSNGVDLALGSFNLSSVDVSIGPDATRGLAYSREWRGAGWRDNLAATISSAGDIDIIVSIGGSSDIFEPSPVAGSGYVSKLGNGATLVRNGDWIYTAADGTVAVFAPANGQYDRFVSNLGYVRHIKAPNGDQKNFTYLGRNYCPHELDLEFRTCRDPEARSVRLQSVTNGFGYQLKLSYASNTLTDSEDLEAWQTLGKVTAINNAVEACDASADTCTLSNTWPHATYTKSQAGTEETVSDLGGTAKLYVYDGSSRIAAVRRPSGADDLTVSYGEDGKVGTVNNAGVAYNYSWRDAEGVRTVVMIDPLNAKRTVTSNIAKTLVLSDADALDRKTTYEYDANDRLKLTSFAEGNAVAVTYDTRGNITQTRLIAKPGSGAAEIVTSATYAATCSNSVTCNKPISTTDAGLAVADYSYYPNHGAVETITMPAPSAGAVRPQTRFGYTATGAITQMSSVSACQTIANCVGTTDEVKTQITYGTQSQNLVPLSTSSGSGDGALTASRSFGYDRTGNLLTVDGPLPGSGDTARTLYDARRRTVGAISPDPDGTGPLKHRASRITYDVDGRATVQESGTVSDQSDAALNAFTSLDQNNSTYDANGRTVKQTLTAGDVTHAAVEYSYDAKGRPLCTAQRMNPASFGSLTNACTLTAAGDFGPDRISRITYDAADQTQSTEVAIGTADAAIEASATYTANGKLASLTDGENNRTGYAFDGHDRLIRTSYPVPQKSAGATSTTDYEELGYDSRSNVVSRRLRDEQSIGYEYDAMSRLTLKNLPGGDPDVTYGHDNLSRLTSASQPGHLLTMKYDALGRKLSETGLNGVVASTYDVAGRKIRLTHPDGFFVEHDYLVTGEMKVIRENGATTGPAVLATFDYDDQGRRKTLMRGNGQATSYSYDPASRLNQLTQELAGTAHDVTLGFTHNPASQIRSSTRSNDAYSWTGHGNGATTATPNGLNQLVQVGPASLTFDKRGNLTVDPGAAPAEERRFGYSSENLLVSHTLAGQAATTIRYDPLMRLFDGAPAGGIATAFQHDGSQMIAETYQGRIAGRYVHGPGSDEPLVSLDRNGAREWMHADERGSIIALSNPDGTMRAINRFDEYGKSSQNIGRFQFTGQARITADLLYYKARMYDPKLGRFLQTDPVGYGDGMNQYAYVGGDPVNFSDPGGLGRDEVRRYIRRHGIDSPKMDGPEIVVTGTRPERSNPQPSIPSMPGPAAPSNGSGEFASGQSPQNDEIVVTARRRIAKALGNFAENYLKPPQGRQMGETFSDCMARLTSPESAGAGAAAVELGRANKALYPRGAPVGASGTSYISTTVRAIEKALGGGRVGSRGNYWFGAKTIGGAIGRGLSMLSVGAGAAVVGFEGGKAVGAAQVCQ